MVSLVITGSPGVGKKTVGFLVSRMLKIKCIDVLELAARANSIVSYDEAAREYLIDIPTTRRYAERLSDCVVVGVLAYEVIEPRLVDMVVVLRASPKLLYRRYLERGYDEKKICVNLMSEALGVVLDECVKKFGLGKLLELDVTHLKPEAAARRITRAVTGLEKPRVLFLDWLEVCLRDPELRSVCFRC